jgi:exocyst complex component 3
MVNNLIEMSNRLDMLEGMLEESRENIIGPAPKLLTIHHMIYQLENFRNAAMHEAKTASADSRNTLARWFERLNHVIEEFNQYILELAKAIVPLVRAGHPDVVVKLIKIAELEGVEDQKVLINSIVCYSLLTLCRPLQSNLSRKRQN